MRSVRSIRCNENVRAFVYVLVVFALTLQQFAPVGLMAAGTTGGLTMVLCSADGMRMITVDADGKPIPQEQDHKCPMCACFQNAHALPAPAIFTVAAVFDTHAVIAETLYRPYTPPYLLYVSTGPPRAAA